MSIVFPRGFLWGAATAAYQIEGAAEEAGRGPSIWDTFCKVPGAVHHGDSAAIACDHYHRYPEDLALAASLGINGYRMSIAWPRVQPAGSGPANEDGLDYYERVVDCALENGLTPLVTLYHWDLPQALQDGGGWTVRSTAERFAEYGTIVGRRLGDRVPMWATVNEPWCSAFVGHLEGRHAPGVRDLSAALAASHHLLLAHGKAVEGLRTVSRGRVGAVVNLSSPHPASDDAADAAAAARVDGNENRWFLDPLLRGSYPDDMLRWYGERADLSPIRDADLAVIAAPTDYLGVNYYERHVVAADPGDPILGARKLPPEGPLTAGGIAIRPDGLLDILDRLRLEYGNPPLYVTENGAAFHDYVDPEGGVDDVERIGYLDGHFRAAHTAVTRGSDLRGYFVWSLLDNFEWALGYQLRFGLVYVDFGTQTRTPKASARWFRGVATTNELPEATAADGQPATAARR